MSVLIGGLLGAVCGLLASAGFAVFRSQKKKRERERLAAKQKAEAERLATERKKQSAQKKAERREAKRLSSERRTNK